MLPIVKTHFATLLKGASESVKGFSTLTNKAQYDALECKYLETFGAFPKDGAKVEVKETITFVEDMQVKDFAVITKRFTDLMAKTADDTQKSALKDDLNAFSALYWGTEKSARTGAVLAWNNGKYVKRYSITTGWVASLGKQQRRDYYESMLGEDVIKSMDVRTPLCGGSNVVDALTEIRAMSSEEFTEFISSLKAE